jgi:hypothetical protein
MKNNENIQSLIDTFDLDTNFFEITDYEFWDGEIVIKSISVLDKSGKFLRLAKLDKVLPYLSQYNTKFKSI